MRDVPGPPCAAPLTLVALTCLASTGCSSSEVEKQFYRECMTNYRPELVVHEEWRPLLDKYPFAHKAKFAGIEICQAKTELYAEGFPIQPYVSHTDFLLWSACQSGGWSCLERTMRKCLRPETFDCLADAEYDASRREYRQNQMEQQAR